MNMVAWRESVKALVGRRGETARILEPWRGQGVERLSAPASGAMEVAWREGVWQMGMRVEKVGEKLKTWVKTWNMEWGVCGR